MQVLYRVSQRVLSPHSPPKLHDLTLSQVVTSLGFSVIHHAKIAPKYSQT